MGQRAESHEACQETQGKPAPPPDGLRRQRLEGAEPSRVARQCPVRQESQRRVRDCEQQAEVQQVEAPGAAGFGLAVVLVGRASREFRRQDAVEPVQASVEERAVAMGETVVAKVRHQPAPGRAVVGAAEDQPRKEDQGEEEAAPPSESLKKAKSGQYPVPQGFPPQYRVRCAKQPQGFGRAGFLAAWGQK